MRSEAKELRKSEDFIPALGYKWLTGWFDHFLRLTLPEMGIKTRLLNQAQIKNGDKVLDLGCGTGTLLILLKRLYPKVEAYGIDADNAILEIARSKSALSRIKVQLDHGRANDLPYQNASFDRVISSLVFHHLVMKDKYLALREAFRILRPGGELHLVDLAPPHNLYAYLVSLIMSRTEQAADNIKGLIPEMIAQAGFIEVEEVHKLTTIFGTLSFYKGKKPLNYLNKGGKI